MCPYFDFHLAQAKRSYSIVNNHLYAAYKCSIPYCLFIYFIFKVNNLCEVLLNKPMYMEPSQFLELLTCTIKLFQKQPLVYPPPNPTLPSWKCNYHRKASGVSGQLPPLGENEEKCSLRPPSSPPLLHTQVLFVLPSHTAFWVWPTRAVTAQDCTM